MAVIGMCQVTDHHPDERLDTTGPPQCSLLPSPLPSLPGGSLATPWVFLVVMPSLGLMSSKGLMCLLWPVHIC